MDFGEALKPTGAEMDEESENNGNDWRIDFDLDVFENDFGAGEFQTFSVSF